MSSNPGHGTFIYESSCCLILYLFFIIIFIVHMFLFYLSTVSFRWYVLFFKLYAICVLKILEYMNRQQQPGKTALICCKDAQADLGLRCPHMQKDSFSHDMALSY